MKTRLATLVLALVIAAACSGNSTPNTPTAASSVMHLSWMVAHGAERALNAANNLSAFIATIPQLSQADKNVYNCAVLRVIGATPSATVTTACGEGVPTVAMSPLNQALTRARVASTCATMREAAVSVLGAVDPLITRLKASTDRSIALAGSMIEALLDFERRISTGEATCRS